MKISIICLLIVLISFVLFRKIYLKDNLMGSPNQTKVKKMQTTVTTEQVFVFTAKMTQPEAEFLAKMLETSTVALSAAEQALKANMLASVGAALDTVQPPQVD